MRAAIFKMVENGETAVSEMINRNIRCFREAVCYPSKCYLFMQIAAHPFTIKFRLSIPRKFRPHLPFSSITAVLAVLK